MKQNEPSLEEIEDFNGRGSEEKRRTVNLVIIGCLIAGALYTVVKMQNSSVSDALPVEQSRAIQMK
ncbi:MAG: hypothetical protein K0U47_10840 [Epsilonproteobacteria bacterium]|nr:hypothetical protein [Campylobacterota bacterium]